MKFVRQQKILQLVKERPIANQRGLVKALAEAGLKVTQATVSRDIRELGLVKVSLGGTIRYVTPDSQGKSVREEERLHRLVRDAVVSLDTSENLVVVKTLPGAAQGVASAVDRAEWPEVIGTVAGDDTFLVVVKPRSMAPVVSRRLKALTAGKK
ncbi:MAG: arginine repressor [Bacillota bacterium]